MKRFVEYKVGKATLHVSKIKLQIFEDVAEFWTSRLNFLVQDEDYVDKDRDQFKEDLVTELISVNWENENVFMNITESSDILKAVLNKHHYHIFEDIPFIPLGIVGREAETDMNIE